MGLTNGRYVTFSLLSAHYGLNRKSDQMSDDQMMLLSITTTENSIQK